MGKKKKSLPIVLLVSVGSRAWIKKIKKQRCVFVPFPFPVVPPTHSLTQTTIRETPVVSPA